jgi:ribonuclease P/MRP protein subunit RPP1
MYEAVHAYPDGEATAARFADAAARYGYDGVVVRAVDAGPDYDRLADAGVDVVDAVEVVAEDPSRASGAVGNYRPKHTLVVVRGGTPALNRFAVEQDRVDVLARPMAGEGDVNHVLAKAARDHGTRIEFDLGPVLRSTGGPRVRALSGLRKLRELVDAYDVPYVVSANPRSHLELRAPRELRAVGEAVGFDADAVSEGLREWGRLAARNRERAGESFIAPGVERGRYEEDD